MLLGTAMSSGRSPLLALWAFGLAFGCVEASTVVYLRATVAQPVGHELFPLFVLSPQLLAIEIVREGCTLLMLAAVACAAGRGWRDRIGAFLLTFGLWDLAYYAALHVMIGWPNSVTDWDILFLIPAPWIAPVWAPAVVAVIFTAVGTYVFSTAAGQSRYGVSDAIVLLAAAVAVVLACLLESGAVITLEQPKYFPVWLYWLGVLTGLGWFLHAELRRTSLRLLLRCASRRRERGKGRIVVDLLEIVRSRFHFHQLP